jgi:tetratricopeptide (TPR) repeat protein
VAQIIRICSISAFALALLSQPALARTNDRSALGSYMQARIADAAGNSEIAIPAYSAAMTASPGNTVVALRAYREAVDAGNKMLAIRAVRQLQQSDALSADARLLVYIDALGTNDWKAARTALDRIEDQGGYDFLVPILRAWVGFAARDIDPIEILNRQSRGSLTSSYAGEHRALILLASGNRPDGIAATKVLGATDARMVPARLAAAAKLQAIKDRVAALDLLQGGDPILSAARTQIESGRPLGGAIDTPLKGTAALLARVSGDLMRDRVSPVALTLARLARFADPKNVQIALIEAQALDINRRDAEALNGYKSISLTSPYAVDARDGMVGLLQRLDKTEDAIVLARSSIAAPSATLVDYVRLGEIYARADNQAEAAKAFAAGIAFAKGADKKGNVPWGLWLLYGGALERSGDWAKARDALKNAVSLAPEQPGALNHLGYSMLERREDVPEAMRLITKASALRPDDAAITDSLGWAFFVQGDLAKAIPLLERAVAIDALEPTLSEHLGDAYWAAGRRVDARYAWRAAMIQSENDVSKKRLDKKIDLGLTPETASR